MVYDTSNQLTVWDRIAASIHVPTPACTEHHGELANTVIIITSGKGMALNRVTMDVNGEFSHRVKIGRLLYGMQPM